MTNEIRLLIKRAFDNLGIDLLGIVPRIELEGRGMIPEVEIRYEEFGAKAIETVERFLDLKQLAELAEPPGKASVDYRAFLEKFKNSLITNFKLDVSEGGLRKS
jgi:hypothetical protein